MPSPPARVARSRRDLVPLRSALRVWALVGLQSFGGPAGQIALMHRVLVEERRWIGERRFLHALNYCMLLPGPEAQQLAIYIGWLLNGVLGGVAAGVLFVAPGFLAMLGLSVLYAVGASVGPVTGLLFGLQAAVVAVVAHAVLRLARRALTGRAPAALAAAAFGALFCFAVPFPVVVGVAALLGLVGGRLRPGLFAAGGHGSASAAPASDDVVLPDDGDALSRAQGRSALRAAACCLLLWVAPVGALLAVVGTGHVLGDEALLFSQTAVVTFGGAYAVLSYVAQQAVTGHGWLRPDDMLAGLGLAETTPGPLILVLQFVGFLAAYRHPGGLDPVLAGVFGSIVTVWVTFVPCFLFIFLGAPWIERLRGNRSLASALSAVTAAVVGVVLNLAVWFALHTAFGVVEERGGYGVRLLVPHFSSIDVASVAVSVGAAVALFRLGCGVLPTLGAAALAGVLLQVAGQVTP